MKFASTLPPASADAFPTVRAVIKSVVPSSAPRQSASGQRLTVEPSKDQTSPLAETPRYRTANRLTTVRKIALTRDDPPQLTENTSAKEPTTRPLRIRPSLLRPRPKQVVESTNDIPTQPQPVQIPNARPASPFALRRGKQLSQPEVNDKLEETADSNPSKPTRRTFTRKQTVASTTPANVRVTKRYHKKNTLKEETTTEPPAPSTTEATVKPFRVATRHQGKQKAQGLKSKKKLDEDVEGANYPEHFKLLLKNKPALEESSNSPTKTFRASPRIDKNPIKPSALRSNPKPRPQIQLITTTATPVTTTHDDYREAEVNYIELEDNKDRSSIPIKANRDEGRGFSSSQNQDQTPLSRVRYSLSSYLAHPITSYDPFQPLDSSPQKFSATYREEEPFHNFQDEQLDSVTPAAQLPPLYQPTIPPPMAASHQQQSVRYIDEKGNYISDQDIAQFVQTLRQQLLKNLITILSSALQSNTVR